MTRPLTEYWIASAHHVLLELAPPSPEGRKVGRVTDISMEHVTACAARGSRTESHDGGGGARPRAPGRTGPPASEERAASRMSVHQPSTRGDCI